MKRSAPKRRQTWRLRQGSQAKGSPEAVEWFSARKIYCEHPYCPNPRTRGMLAVHHVVYAAEIRKLGGNLWDPRNAFTLCNDCHESHHRRGSYIIPLRVLSDDNLEFAFELLGPYAFDYLQRLYSGADDRLDPLLDVAEEKGRADAAA